MAKEKQILAWDQIKEKLQEKKEDTDKMNFLKGL